MLSNSPLLIYSDVSIVATGRASIIFATAFASLQTLDNSGPLPPAASSLVEILYFSIIFLIRSIVINRSKHKESNAQHAVTGLHRLFLSTLYDWFDTLSNKMLSRLSPNPQNLQDTDTWKLIAMQWLVFWWGNAARTPDWFLYLRFRNT